MIRLDESIRAIARRLLAVGAGALALVVLLGCGAAPLQAQQPTVRGDQMWIEFAQGASDQRVAQFFVWPRKSQDGFREVLVHFPHIQDVGYRLESFTVEVVAEGVIKPLITFEPEYAWDAMQVKRIDNGVQVRVPDTGWVGESTIDLSFWLPERVMAEHDIVVRTSLRTKHGEGAGELRLREGKPLPPSTILPVEHRGNRAPEGLARIIHFGGGELAGAVVERMAALGVEVVSLQGLEEFPVSSDMALVFDGAWFAGHHDNADLHATLQEVTSLGAPVLAIGEQTSLLLEGLRLAGVTDFTPGRNPARSDPPQVGFQLRRDGERVYPAHLSSNTTELGTLVDAVTRWYEGGFEEAPANQQ